jgi:uncharacterized membrane protein
MVPLSTIGTSTDHPAFLSLYRTSYCVSFRRGFMVLTRQANDKICQAQNNSIYDSYEDTGPRFSIISALEGGLIAATNADDQGIFVPAGTIYASYAVSGGFWCDVAFLSRESPYPRKVTAGKSGWFDAEREPLEY